MLFYSKMRRAVAASGQKLPRTTTLKQTVVDERRALLQRILWSRQIERSGRIREFLSYVCERSLADSTVEIHEQEIGHAVFGRSADYDTALDNIVRVTASQARRKLELYFASDGGSEPVLLEIPKGQYTPVFRPRTVAEAEAVPAPPQTEPSTPGIAAETVAVLPPGSAAIARYRRLLTGALVCIV